MHRQTRFDERSLTVLPALTDVPAGTAKTPAPATTARTTTRTTTTTRTPTTTRRPTTSVTSSGNTVTRTPGNAAGAKTGTIAAGSTLNLTSGSKVCTNTNKVGDHFTATVTNSITGSNGAVIPAGATADVEVTELKRSENANDNVVMGFRVTSVKFGGHTYPVSATTSGSAAIASRGRPTENRKRTKKPTP